MIHSVPLECPFGLDEQHLSDLDAGQSGLALPGLFEGRLRGQASVGVRIEVHQSRLGDRRPHAGSVLKRKVLVEVPRGAVPVQFDARPDLIEGFRRVAEEASHQRPFVCRQ